MPEPKLTAEKSDIPKSDSVMHSFKEGKASSSIFTPKLLIVLLIVALVGVGTGYFLAGNGGKTGIESLDRAASKASVQKGQTFGSDDTEIFKDIAEGEVKKGGIGDEGSHTLIRPGGESQTVCMTSSHVDLDTLVGRQVKVWGQTNAADTCGWLMDVGRVQVLD